MTKAEQEQLQQLLSQLISIKLPEKDQAAESLILEALAKQPDAAYLLIQRSLLQDQALQAAQTQISDLQNKLKQKQTDTQPNQFLHNDPWALAAKQRATANVPGAATYKIPNNDAPFNPQDYGRPIPQAQNQGLGSSFLGNVATTAAGVVAGSFLFQGIGNLLGHHHASPDFDHHATADHASHEQVHDQHDNNDNSPFHLASDDDGDSFFADSDSDSDWI